MQDSGISIALAMEILQSCIKPSMLYSVMRVYCPDVHSRLTEGANENRMCRLPGVVFYGGILSSYSVHEYTGHVSPHKNYCHARSIRSYSQKNPNSRRPFLLLFLSSELHHARSCLLCLDYLMISNLYSFHSRTGRCCNSIASDSSVILSLNV